MNRRGDPLNLIRVMPAKGRKRSIPPQPGAIRMATDNGSDPMNKPVSSAELKLPKVTTGPLPASRKLYARPEMAPDLRVPVREIALTEGSGEPPLPVYDTTGPYTDPDVAIDVEKGLARGRTAWVKERGGVEQYDGRQVKPEDNGNVGEKHAARVFPIVHRPLRGIDINSTPLPTPPPQGGREQAAASDAATANAARQ